MVGVTYVSDVMAMSFTRQSGVKRLMIVVCLVHALCSKNNNESLGEKFEVFIEILKNIEKSLFFCCKRIKQERLGLICAAKVHMYSVHNL